MDIKNLTKEQAKKQFVEKTKELGIKHDFTFDEAWEIGEELRLKIQNYLSSIDAENIRAKTDRICKR